MLTRLIAEVLPDAKLCHKDVLEHMKVMLEWISSLVSQQQLQKNLVTMKLFVFNAKMLPEA